MNLEQIIAEWKKDAPIEMNALDASSVQISSKKIINHKNTET